MYYFKNGQVRGVLLWQIFGLVQAPRLIGSRQPVAAQDLIAQLQLTRTGMMGASHWRSRELSNVD
jgi:hypothetical protein